MSLENIKNAIHQGVNELFATATVEELAGDMKAYREKLATIATVADALGIETELTEVSLNLKQ
jgi:hypothetical protein